VLKYLDVGMGIDIHPLDDGVQWLTIGVAQELCEVIYCITGYYKLYSDTIQSDTIYLPSASHRNLAKFHLRPSPSTPPRNKYREKEGITDYISNITTILLKLCVSRSISHSFMLILRSHSIKLVSELFSIS
jgi:hypothetical protein